jgi:polyisoprenoid-binding protein YceI
MKTIPATIAFILLLVLATSTLAGASPETIVVLVDRSSPHHAYFSTHVIPRIDSLVTANGIAIEVIDVAGGAPEEVAITPLVLYQNARGRSIYQGRYTDVAKIGHFVRVSRWVAQEQVPLPVPDAVVRRMGRAQVAVHVKVTALEGTAPAPITSAALTQAARRVITTRLPSIEKADDVTLRRTDRQFFMDFYPFGSDDGQLMVSLALFSQFDCVTPIYASQEPVTGDWVTGEAVFANALAELERAMQAAIAAPETGDGFHPIVAETPARSWESLGLSLPPVEDSDASSAEISGGVPARWIASGPPPDDLPRVQYRFMPPLDSYTGEAHDVEASLGLDDDAALRNAEGWVSVTAASVTTGQAKLDRTMHNTVLKSKKFPDARFLLESFNGDLSQLRWGDSRTVTVAGMFELAGMQVPLTANAQLLPIVNDSGEPRLLVTASARINIKQAFGFEGPLGPLPAAETMEFHVNLTMTPVEP